MKQHYDSSKVGKMLKKIGKAIGKGILFIALIVRIVAIPVMVLFLIGMLVHYFYPREGTSRWREINGLVETKYKTYEINSIRVDDDAEFHVVAVSKSGHVRTIRDGRRGFDLNVSFGRYDRPMMKIKMTDRVEEGVFEVVRGEPPTVLIPLGYEIETFSDSFW